MGEKAALIILLICCPLLIFIIHIILARTVKSSQQLIAGYAMVVGYLPLICALVVIHRSFNGEISFVIAFIYSVIIYSCLGYTYFHFYNMSETSRRIRLLYEVKRAGHLEQRSIKELYNADDIIRLRLSRLVELKQLVREDDGCYRIVNRILYYSAIVVFGFQKLLGFRNKFN